jgi:hypothetical protein
MIEANRVKPRNANPNDPFLLRGLLQCECGSRMASTCGGVRKYRYYDCWWVRMTPKMKSQIVNQKTCKMPRVRAEELEVKVLGDLKFYLGHPSQLIHMLEKEVQAENLKGLTDELNILQVK